MTADTHQALSDSAQLAWEKRRPTWSRNESVRWLNDESALVLAWVRRRAPGVAPKHSNAMGRWLAEHMQVNFTRAHARLCAAAEGKQQLTVLEVLS